MAKRTERFTIHRSLDRWHPHAAGRKQNGLSVVSLREPDGCRAARSSDVTEPRAGYRLFVPTVGDRKLTRQRPQHR